ncbi:MAG: hypothetical protein LBU72_02310 [Burkholderiaceae bacterium]|jgi:hypothetical protein|nr:hypothetical protein [Burkholderiaceae bacterium]
MFVTKAIAANCTVAATFTPIYTVTPSVSGSNGTISPATAVSSVKGLATASFTLKSVAGYVGSAGGTCVGTLGGNTFKTSAITQDCTVVATFALAGGAAALHRNAHRHDAWRFGSVQSPAAGVPVSVSSN